MITDSVFNQNEIDIYKQNSKQRLSVNLTKSDFVANRLIDSYLYGANHPYGTVTNAVDIDGITQPQLKDLRYEVLPRLVLRGHTALRSQPRSAGKTNSLRFLLRCIKMRKS